MVAVARSVVAVEDRAHHAPPALARRTGVRTDGLAVALSPRDRLSDAWPTGRTAPLGRAECPCHLPSGIPPAAMLSGHASEGGCADAGHAPLDTTEDDRSEAEQRFITIGMDALGRILVVVYTYRGESIRLISARPATKQEQKDYETGI